LIASSIATDLPIARVPKPSAGRKITPFAMLTKEDRPKVWIVGNAGFFYVSTDAPGITDRFIASRRFRYDPRLCRISSRRWLLYNASLATARIPALAEDKYLPSRDERGERREA
jgi:hypothetical protein